MKLFNTHTCEVYIYGDNQTKQCQMETQTRCSTCKKWCCSLHREQLTRDLKRGVVLCSDCLERQEE